MEKRNVLQNFNWPEEGARLVPEALKRRLVEASLENEWSRLSEMTMRVKCATPLASWEVAGKTVDFSSSNRMYLWSVTEPGGETTKRFYRNDEGDHFMTYEKAAAGEDMVEKHYVDNASSDYTPIEVRDEIRSFLELIGSPEEFLG